MRAVLGLRDLFSGKRRRAARARKLELKGDLDTAAALYAEAELPDDAARVLLLHADAERDPERRVILCAQAARLGGASEHGRQAAQRKALLSFDLVRATPGAALRGELLAIAGELEAAQAWEKAAEAYALAGDTDNEIRVLKEAGAIDQLEDRLHEEAEQDRRERERRQLLRRMTDLDRVAERRAALQLGAEWLDREIDEAVQLEVQRIRGRLLEGPAVQLVVSGQAGRYVLGSEVTIGRSGATLTVYSQSVSRQHLRVFRQQGAPWVEDLATRNGTTLAGARLEAPLPVGAGVSLTLANQVDCRLQPVDPAAPTGPVMIELGGLRTIAPLGPQPIGSWLLVDAHDGADRFVVLRTPEGAQPPFMNGFRLVRQVELCVGDALQQGRDGPVRLQVPEQTED